MATYVNTVTEQDTIPPREAHLPWKQTLWFAALLILCYAPVLYRLVMQWKNDEDMGHGFFVPIIAGYIVWQRRFQLAKLKPEPNYWGLLLIFWGALQLMLGTLGAVELSLRLNQIPTGQPTSTKNKQPNEMAGRIASSASMQLISICLWFRTF